MYQLKKINQTKLIVRSFVSFKSMNAFLKASQVTCMSRLNIELFYSLRVKKETSGCLSLFPCLLHVYDNTEVFPDANYVFITFLLNVCLLCHQTG